jgi:hypothetical protein
MPFSPLMQGVSCSSWFKVNFGRIPFILVLELMHLRVLPIWVGLVLDNGNRGPKTINGSYLPHGFVLRYDSRSRFWDLGLPCCWQGPYE